MPLLDPLLNEVYSVRIFKSYQGFNWVNTYELRCADSAATYGDLQTAALALATRERSFHFNWVQFDKLTISTYVPDGQPYDPNTFTTVTLEVSGLRGYSGEGLPLDICVYVKRNVLSGRNGKHFYRGCLEEADVTFGGRRFEIGATRRTAIANEVQGQISDVQPLFALCLARGTPLPTNIRDVIGATVNNLTSTKQLDNPYYNRNRGGTGGGSGS